MNTPLRRRIDTRRAIAAFIRRRFLWPTIMLPLIFGLAACGGGAGGGNGPGSKALDLVIGNSLPLSGSSKSLGESGQKASEVAVERIKQAAASSGADHNVRIVNADQGSDTDSAVESARTLVDADGSSCLIGPWSSEAVAQVAQDVVVPGEVLQISPVAAGDDVAELNDHDLVNSTALPQAVLGSAMSDAVDGDLGGAQGHTVNVATNHGSYGDTVGQDFIESWQDDDGTVGEHVVLSAPPLSTAPSGSDAYYGSSSNSSVYSGQVYQLLNDNPDAVVIIDDLNGFTALAPALAADSSWDPAGAWGGDQLVSPALSDQVGADTIDGFRALAPGMPTDAEASTAFVTAFKQARPHDVALAPYGAQQFDATILCYLAAVAAGSTDGQKMGDELIDITAPGGTEYSWQQLPEAIKALEDGEDIDYTGASGPLDMDVHGNPRNGVFDIYEYGPGGLNVVGEVPVEKPNPATP
jgi:ABC-type branched-subunit amino acid transport system substrate-binding protein